MKRTSGTKNCSAILLSSFQREIRPQARQPLPPSPRTGHRHRPLPHPLSTPHTGDLPEGEGAGEERPGRGGGVPTEGGRRVLQVQPCAKPEGRWHDLEVPCPSRAGFFLSCGGGGDPAATHSLKARGGNHGGRERGPKSKSKKERVRHISEICPPWARAKGDRGCLGEA